MAKKKSTDASVKPVKAKKPAKKAAVKKTKKPTAKKPVAKKTVKKPASKKATTKKPTEKKSEKTGATTVPVVLNTGSVVMVAVDDPNTTPDKMSVDSEGRVVVRDANGKVIGAQG